jgi:DNA-binding NarL/FixJ family response regulator
VVENSQTGSEDRLTVALVDDHDLFRRGLREMLEERGLEVVGEARSGEDAIELVEEQQPDVVVMDVHLSGLSGIEATRRLAVRAPRSQVLMLTISVDDGDITEALMSGAAGYLLKDASIDAVVAGIEAAARGEASISPRIATRLLHHIRNGKQAPDEPPQAHADLTGREIDVLRLLAGGKGNSEIAAQLFISPKTVKNHIASILMKLQMENRIQAAVYAVRSGII